MRWGIYARAGQISSGGSPSYSTINGYYDGSDGTSLCTLTASSSTVYSSTYSTIADAYTNSNSIYSDSALTTLATTGYYTDILETIRYSWNSSTPAWVSATACPPPYITIDCYYEADNETILCTESVTRSSVYSSTYSSIRDSYDNSSPIYSDSALTTLAPAGFYTDELATTNYTWDSSWIDFKDCE